jgi:magnesium-transporting ATPase (P-type)
MSSQIQEEILLNEWMKECYSESQLIQILSTFDFDQETTQRLLNNYKKKRLNERTRQGFILLAIGSFFGFLSCVLTVLGVLPEIKGVILYGLTGLGVILALWGGYLVFE